MVGYRRIQYDRLVICHRTPRVAADSGWRHPPQNPIAFGSFRQYCYRSTFGSFWKKLGAFLGPGYLVAVGYMDPGNWATSLAGGSKFGYALLTIALLSNIMAIVLQALCARLGIAAGRDLAQACRDAFPRAVSWPLWVLAEIAICATDLAEVIGTAIGLNLLVRYSARDRCVDYGARRVSHLVDAEPRLPLDRSFIVTLLGVIAVCFAVQIAMADPDWGG